MGIGRGGLLHSPFVGKKNFQDHHYIIMHLISNQLPHLPMVLNKMSVSIPMEITVVKDIVPVEY